MQKPDLLLLIAIWEFLSALFALMILTAVVLFVFSWAFPVWNEALVGGLFLLSLLCLALGTYAGLAVAAGIGLLTGREWGRVASIVHGALSALSVPVGTIIGVLTIVYLTKTEVRDYFQGGAG
jgi:hypothetical protein